MITMVLKNIKDQFNRLNRKPIFINDLDISDPVDKELIQSNLYTRYTEKTLDVVPSCECGFYHGNDLKGEICPRCGDRVEPAIDKHIESVLWFRPPQGIDKLVHPKIWTTLTGNFVIKANGLKFKIIPWLCDPSERTLPEVKGYTDAILASGIKRGLNFFHEHYLDIVDYLLYTLYRPKGVKYTSPDDGFKETAVFFRQNITGVPAWFRSKSLKDDVRKFLYIWERFTFVDELPIPNKIMFIAEKTAVKTYINKKENVHASDAVWTIASVADCTRSPMRKKLSRTVRALNQLATYHEKAILSNLVEKESHYRRHIFGYSTMWSLRGVITSISRPHKSNELIPPWQLSVELFKVDITNKLMKKGLDPDTIAKRITYAYRHYDPEIDEIFKELIAESFHPEGVPVEFQRNPSLKRLSMYNLIITEVKTDVDDNTISLSVTITKHANADFDGDQMNMKRVMDRDQQGASQRFGVETGVFDLNGVLRIDGAIQLHSPVVSTLLNWITAREES